MPSTLIMILVSIFSCTVFFLAIFVRWNQNSEEPPMLWHWLPFVGHGIPLAKDFRSFFNWANAQAKGNPFSMVAGGDKYHIFHRPEDVAAIYRKSATLTEIRDGHNMFRRNILGFGKEDAEKIAGLRAEELKLDATHLLGTEELNTMIVDYFGELDILLGLKDDTDRLSKEQREKKLLGLHQDALEWIGDLMLRATLATLYGPGVFEDYIWVFRDIETFMSDKFFLRSIGLPDIFAKKATLARERIKSQLRDVIRSLKNDEEDDEKTNSDTSNYIKQRVNVMTQMGLGEEGLVANEFELILGANMNSIPMAYITFLRLLCSVPLLKSIRDEISECNWNTCSPKARAAFLPDGLPRLYALFLEVMRFHATTWSLREVQAPTTLELRAMALSADNSNPKPQVYELQKGSIVGTPSSLLHYNPEIHEKPEKFDADRFLSRELGGKGTPVTARTLRPFGGGVSYCPGRKFAEKQVLGLIASLVMAFDVEVTSKNWDIPNNADFVFVIGCKGIEVEVLKRGDPLVHLQT